MKGSKGINLCLIVLIVTGVTATGTVSAQSNAQEVEYSFGDSLQVVGYEVDTDSGLTTIQFRAEHNVEVVITDAYIDSEATGQDRQMNRERYNVNGNQEIEFNSTIVNGNGGVTVDAQGQLVAFVEESGSGPILGEGTYNPLTLFAQGIAGFGMGITIVLIVAYYKRAEYANELEKVL